MARLAERKHRQHWSDVWHEGDLPMHDKKTVLTDLIGVHIGERLADRREALGLSQVQLAGEAGVSPTRLEKYEAGEVRIPAARLFVFATILGVPLSFFFDEMPKEVASTLIARDQIAPQPQQDLEPDPRATILVDGWHDDWRALWWIRVEAIGSVVRAGGDGGCAPDELAAVAAALRTKYPQYAEVELFPGTPTLLRFVPDRITSWAASAEAERRILEDADG